MSFFDKVKNAATAAKESVKNAADSAKAAREQKKAEQEAYNAEMSDKAARKAAEIVAAVQSYNNDGNFFRNTQTDELLTFTKDFYDKILMPANSVSKSKISMHPFIPEKKLNKFREKVNCYESTETPIVYLGTDEKKEFVITDKALYFVLPLEEAPKFFATGRIPCDEISSFRMEQQGENFCFMCDEYVLSTLKADKATTEDFITLNNYFSCVLKHDFVITDEEVDRLIQEKIGSKVYAEVKKYMVYDDELLVYFAWGLDSLSAKDYLVCTNKQIITVNREMMGATANIKQFYYEDITSASVLQNSNNSSLGGYLLETALTAATQTCDLVITVSGATNRINTLYKVEAERVVAVYHQFRKAVKQQAAVPQQVIVQQTTQADPLEQLQKLSQLKEAGILSEEEFNQKKTELLAKL